MFSEVSALKRKRFESVLRTIRSKCVTLIQSFNNNFAVDNGSTEDLSARAAGGVPMTAAAYNAIGSLQESTVVQNETTSGFFEEGESAIDESARREDRLMPVTDFHQVRKDGMKDQEMAQPESQLFQRRVNLG